MGASVVLCAPPTLVPPGIEALAPVTYRIDEAVEGADAIMMLRIQLERMSGGFFPSLREYHQRFGLTEERVRRAKKDVVILHPGPMNRGVEIASEVADGPVLGDPRPGHERGGRAHGRALLSCSGGSPGGRSA